MLTITNRESALSHICQIMAALLLLFAGFLASTSAARADIISISGATFQQQCPCPASGNAPNINRGVLIPTDQATVYAPVDFPVNGQEICSFSLIYRDTNANDTMTARLLRKPFAVGSNPANNPTVVATAATAPGVVNTVRKATTSIIGGTKINENNAFYYVEVSIPTTNFGLLGVQIDHRATCP